MCLSVFWFFYEGIRTADIFSGRRRKWLIHVFLLTNTKWKKSVEILETHNLPCCIRNLRSRPFTYQEFLQILRLTDNGLEDIMTTRGVMKSKLIEQGIHIEALSLRDAYSLIVQYPNLLRLPILTDFKRLGLGTSGVDKFIQRERRRLQRENLTRGEKEGIEIAVSSIQSGNVQQTAQRLTRT